MRQILSFLLLLLCSTMLAQELSVKEFREVTNDLSARTRPRQDNNGNDCALVKVQMVAPSASFTGNVMGDVAFKNNEYWVYMTAGSKRLKITQPSYLPLEVSFADYGISQLIGKSTYVLTLLLGDLPQGIQQPKVLTGWILLDSDPQGASVYINDVFVGNTPLDGYKQPYGTYSYRVEHPNYHSLSGSIELNTGRLEKKITLQPAFGAISIRCNVAGATVLLDSKTTGQKAPCTLQEVASGQHTITIQMEKYAPRQEIIVVEDGKTADVDISLNACFATISIASLEGAQIFCNGKEIGKTAVMEDLMEGYYDIEVKLNHHKTVTKQIQVAAGQPQQITLNPIPIYGSLDIISTPRDADIIIDGKPYGKTPFTVEQLLEGEHTVILSKDGYAKVTKDITIHEKELTPFNVILDEVIDIFKNLSWNEISKIIKSGEIDKQALTKVIELYKTQDDVQSYYILGRMYLEGRGVTQDYNEAAKWYRKAAELGHALGQNELGYLYIMGMGVVKNYSEAVMWFKKATEQGIPEAYTNLGSCYKNGEGVPQDYNDAVKWYRKAAELGEVQAQNSLAICYKNGEGVPQDYNEAAKWYRKAAEQGQCNSQNQLAWLYEEGKGVPQDYNEAAKWYRKAAEQGNSNASGHLGYLFEYGKGVQQDYNEAVKWYRKAAELGEAGAQRNLGYMYYIGRGVPQNNNEAAKWFRKAAEQGDAKAKAHLQKMGY